MAEFVRQLLLLSVEKNAPNETMSESRFHDFQPVAAGNSNCVVFSAIDTQFNRRVAIKYLSFDAQYTCKILSEVSLLRRMKHENIVTTYEFLTSSSLPVDQLRQAYIVQELLDTDLELVIRSGQLTASHAKLFMYQLLRGLKYAHSAELVHRDLRPKNILISCQDLMLKISDFGIIKNLPTENADSFWYHPPEVLLNADDNCGPESDIWSAGCILAEMINGQPVFRGSGLFDQLSKVIDSVYLSESDWSKVFRIMPNKMLKNHPLRPRNPIRYQLNAADIQAIHLLEMLLSFNADHRPTASEALSLPYFTEYHCPDDEPDFQLLDSPLEDTIEVCSDENVLMSTIITPTEDSIYGQRSNSSSTCLLPTRSLDDIVNFEGQPGYDMRQLHIGRDDVALKNFRNNQERSTNDDRTPSPNIIDLLNGSFESDSSNSSMSGSMTTGVKDSNGKLHEADSDNEKETAELSEEKIREDLEIGNVVALLQKFTKDLHVSEVAVGLPSQADRDTGELALISSSKSAMFSRREHQKVEPAQLQKCSLFSPEFSDRGLGDKGLMALSPAEELKPDLLRVSVSDEGDAGDSNKLDDGCSSGEKQKLKYEYESDRISRKLILDKIESEKQQRREMSRMNSNLTSEEFDELYRLPTEHLRKDRARRRQTLDRPRPPHRYADDMNERFNSHHKDERILAEGACGGNDYLDDMQVNFSRSSIEFDLEPYLPDLVVESVLSVDEAELSSDIGISRPTGRGLNLSSRETTSSPESPASPRTVQTGARPKKSPKKYRAM